MVWDENRIDLLEEFKVILMDTNMKCIAISHVCIGKYGSCIVEPRQIFATALIYHASGLVLAHNHPDGDLRPRKSDFDITEKMAFGGSILGIQIHDHLILSSKGYLSFAKEKMMPQPMYL